MDLGDWRTRINNLDSEILNLVSQRAEAALQIGDLKRRQGLPTYAPEREVEVLRRLTQSNPGPLPAAAIEAVWREIISACLRLEHPVTIAFLGPPTTFTHQAALSRFGAAAEYWPSRTIAETFDDVERTTEGAVSVSLDKLIDTELTVAGEIYLDIAQQLLSHARELSDIKRVLSHPQGIAQCRTWLARNLPEAQTEVTASTAGAVEMAASDPSIAAIASDLAGQKFGVPVLRARIEDNQQNATRFLVISPQRVGPTGRDKTSICFAMRNEPGTLHRILEPFARVGLNLTKIESRPARQRSWDYVMFVDFEGHRDTPVVADVLKEIGTRTRFLKILGSYPAA
jgi:chorismate mutase/prephenate dehydratase